MALILLGWMLARVFIESPAVPGCTYAWQGLEELFYFQICFLVVFYTGGVVAMVNGVNHLSEYVRWVQALFCHRWNVCMYETAKGNTQMQTIEGGRDISVS